MRTLADLPIPTLVTSYENTIAAYERPGLTPQARESHNRFRAELAEALEVAGFLVDPEVAFNAAYFELGVRQSREEATV